MSISHPESAETVMPSLEADAWMRFDLWSARAWEAAEKAIKIAAENDITVNLDPRIDTRILTLFHADEVAREFAAMTNPRFAAPGGQCSEPHQTNVSQEIASIMDEWDD